MARREGRREDGGGTETGRREGLWCQSFFPCAWGGEGLTRASGKKDDENLVFNSSVLLAPGRPIRALASDGSVTVRF
jgi:hypothetical protein